MHARLTYETCEDGPVTFELTADNPVTLGRSRDNAIVLRDELASRVHARVFFEHDQWHVEDFGLNGTLVNGARISRRAELSNGDEVRIGDARLRFTVGESAGAAVTKRIPKLKDTLPDTKLLPDDLSVLCRFMAAAVEESDPRELIRKALAEVLQRAEATFAGFLSLDPHDPLAKLVIPEQAKVDVSLSRELTRRVQREGKTVWLGTDLADTRATDSLTPFTDALCLPVRASGQPFGALHVYKLNSFFTERDVRFCEALTGYLGSTLQVIRARRNLEAENVRLRGHSGAVEELVGDSPALQQVRQQIARAAAQPSTVLIRGESGVGKELVALALHRQSHRNGPLVTVNCAAIAPNLLESELFGYRRGAFSGADRDHPGLFQQADEGTLFLDEIGEMSLECQAKLLRAIESKAFRPVGSVAEVKADVRIIAATNRDPDAEVRAKRFKQDLLYRLAVITIQVPPLREHPEDVPYLVQYFLDKLAGECRRQVSVTDAAVRKLAACGWPGNVRQLRTVLENAVVMTERDALDASDFRFPDDTPLPETGQSLRLEDLERWAVAEAVKRTKGNKTQAARLLGITRDTLAAKLEKYQIPTSTNVE